MLLDDQHLVHAPGIPQVGMCTLCGQAPGAHASALDVAPSANALPNRGHFSNDETFMFLEHEYFDQKEPHAIGGVHLAATGASPQDPATIVTTVSSGYRPNVFGQNCDGALAKTSNENAVLHNINLNFLPGQLVIVVGPVGSGKSTLLASILGETYRAKHDVNQRLVAEVSGSIAISTQKAWIFSGSVRENIVFERPFDQQRYDAVIRACQLVQDINDMHAGDDTEIGERGI
jgi:ABC-type multidrug transport system fused ATPase/permease subunit